MRWALSNSVKPLLHLLDSRTVPASQDLAASTTEALLLTLISRVGSSRRHYFLFLTQNKSVADVYLPCLANCIQVEILQLPHYLFVKSIASLRWPSRYLDCEPRVSKALLDGESFYRNRLEKSSDHVYSFTRYRGVLLNLVVSVYNRSEELGLVWNEIRICCYRQTEALRRELHIVLHHSSMHQLLARRTLCS